LEPSGSCGDDFVGIGFPNEGLGLGIVLGDQAVDGGLQVDDAMEHAMLQSPAGEFGEEALDGDKPFYSSSLCSSSSKAA